MAEKTLGEITDELKLTCQERGLFSQLRAFLNPQDADSGEDDIYEERDEAHDATMQCIPEVLVADAERKLAEAKVTEVSPEIAEMQRVVRLAKEIVESVDAVAPNPVKIAERLDRSGKGYLFLVEGIMTTDWTPTETGGTSIGVRNERSRTALIAYLRGLDYTVLE
jgi:hypothetical protein